MKYDHQTIEPKWQKRWLDERVFSVTTLSPAKAGVTPPSLPTVPTAGASGHLPSGRVGTPTTPRPSSGRRGCYVLDMFPYPSGDGLHVGHPEGYTATDIYCRYLRMKSVTVLHPMGWDAFGLPAENAAIQKKTHPRLVTAKNVANFKRQIQSLGFSYDWEREVNTTDPKYYKWTQWIFLQLYKHGLAYEKESPIWWCPKDKTGLANEEVVNGKCDRCGTTVEKKLIRQWLLKITAYADRLVSGLDNLDWPEGIKTLQRNWIGKSEGAEVTFDIDETQKVKRIVILHGRASTSKDHFYPKLRRYLELKGFEVLVPDMPIRNGEPDDEEQTDFVRKNCALDEQTVVVGHSFGGIVALRLLERGVKLNGVVLVATPYSGEFVDKVFRPTVTAAAKKGFKFTTIKKNCGYFEVLGGTNDTAVPLADSTAFAEELGVKATLVDSSKPHFQGEDEPAVIKALIPSVRVFTTRPDTLFGATYLVLSPEHELVKQITTEKQKKAVEKYIQSVVTKSDLERTSLDKEKTGVFTGAYAINPVNNEKIPVWIADYVLAGYGTGAIMAVPAHDERDFEFAKKYDLPIREVVIPYRYYLPNPPRPGKKTKERKNVHAIVTNPANGKILTIKWKQQPWTTFPMGGIDDGEDIVAAAERELREETGYMNVRLIDTLGGPVKSEYFAAHKDENRVSYTSAVRFELIDEQRQELAAEDADQYEIQWLDPKDITPERMTHAELDVWQDRMASGVTVFTGGGAMFNSGRYDGLSSTEGWQKIVAWLAKEGQAKFAVNYKLRDWVFSRQRYWGEPIPLVHCGQCKQDVESTKWVLNFYNTEGSWDRLMSGEKTVETRALNPEEPEKYFGHMKDGDVIKGVCKSENVEAYFRIVKTHKLTNLQDLLAHPDLLYKMKRLEKLPTLNELRKGYAYTPDYVDRIEKNGLIAWEIERVIPGVVPIPEDQLPLKLPDVKNYEPTGTGESPLAVIDEWVDTKCPKCSGPAKRETNTMPQWAGSCWYYLRYLDPHNDTALASPEAMKAWLPVDLYVGGAEHAVLHLLYARFWHMVLFDAGVIPKECGDEPFVKLKNQGLILGPDGEKMSKSRGNVINPDEIVEKYGADTLRMYEMFMGPFEDAKPWDTNGIVGIRRFLDKVWRISGRLADMPANDRYHKYVKMIGEGIENFRFNTCVSDLMKWLNEWGAPTTPPLRGTPPQAGGEVPKVEFEIFLKLLNPFAPHMTEELWLILGHETMLAQEKWPTHDKSKVIDATVTIAVQVMGKLRATIIMPTGSDQSVCEAKAEAEPNVAKYLTREPSKVIFVKDKLINFVV